MRYKSCNLLEHGLVFAPFSLIPCCAQPAAWPEIYWRKEYNGELLDIQEYEKYKKEIIDGFKKGQPHQQCANCYRLEERDWPEETFFNKITISHETKCSCRCIYCILHDDVGGKEFFNTRKAYDIFPPLNDLLNKGLIAQHSHFDIAGGECTEYKNGELDKILDIVMKTDSTVFIASSGIIYSESIAKVLKKGVAKLSVSVDSGTRETYEKIKNVKAYDKVWANLEKYIQNETHINHEYSSVILKYIILPGINDSVEEARIFLEKAASINCRQIWIDLEYLWWEENKGKQIPESVVNVVKYFASRRSDTPMAFVEKLVYLERQLKSENKLT